LSKSLACYKDGTTKSSAVVKSLQNSLAELTFGEALPDGITLLSGANGCGKTAFCEQYAYEFLDSGGKVAWITTEELPSSLRASLKKFGWITDRFENDQTLLFYDAVSPSRLGLSENAGRGMLGIDPTGILIAISEQIRSEAKPERFMLVIDSISRLLLSCEPKAVIDFLSCLNSRMENARVKGFATVSEDVHEEKLLNSLIFSTAGTIRFRMKEVSDRRQRQLRVEILRGRKHDDSWKNYTIGSAGIEIETASL
jgi:KaiC/GvpD/RAD55 family RecA-like ATPase